MQITEIKVAGLKDFLKGNLWQNLSPKPITLLRAISQSKNPRANPENVALIIAYEDNRLLGLVGLLPDFIHGESSMPASSNSCWWVDPQKGKHLAVPLFLKAFTLCEQRMFMTDCMPHTLRILSRTNWFDFPETPSGIRGFLKFNLHEVIPSKFPSTGKFINLLKLGDYCLNFLLIPYLKLKQNRFRKIGCKVEYLSVLNEEMHQFIEIHSQDEFIRRSGIDLEWIVQNPWIKQLNNEKRGALVEYPFSHLVKQFKQYFVKITDSGQTIGLVLISLRDGHLKVPYSYFHENHAQQVIKVIYRECILQNAVTFTVFSPEMVKQMSTDPQPFIFRKRIKRLIAISKQLSDSYQKYPVLQDGDGDIVFT